MSLLVIVEAGSYATLPFACKNRDEERESEETAEEGIEGGGRYSWAAKHAHSGGLHVVCTQGSHQERVVQHLTTLKEGPVNQGRGAQCRKDTARNRPEQQPCERPSTPDIAA